MGLCDFVLFLFVCLLIATSEFTLQAFAAKLCPFRAFAVASEEVGGGFKCVCRREFYGKDCRFSGGNSSNLTMDAYWKERNMVVVTWKTTVDARLDDFQLYVRHVHYDERRMPYYAKWRSFSVLSLKMINTSLELKNETARGLAAFRRTLAVQLPMAQSFYQLRLVMTTEEGGKIASPSVFVDGFEFLSLDSKSFLTTSNETKDDCRWYECPGKFFHFDQIMEDFGKPCFKHGMTLGVPIGCIGMLLVFAVTKVAPRATTRCKKRLRIRNCTLKKKTAKNASHAIDITSKAETQENEGVKGPTASSGSVAIELENPSVKTALATTKVCRLDTYYLATGEVKSTILNIPETELIDPEAYQREPRRLLHWLSPSWLFKYVPNPFTTGRKLGGCE